MKNFYRNWPNITRSAGESFGRVVPACAWLILMRSTTLEAEPKVANRHLDLLRLYKRVVEEGGYDKVSDTKGNRLAWRRIAGEFLPGSSRLTTEAFLIKSAYYKNLA
jgi:hypothetical protein